MLALVMDFRRFAPIAHAFDNFTVFRGHSGGGTPGHIPNPEVKPSSADGTARATVWESRTPRTFFFAERRPSWAAFAFGRS
jgi:hypothetical protein